MTSTAPVLLYRTRYCPFCVAAEQFLKSREIEFEEEFLDDHPNRRELTNSIMPGHGTVPLVLIHGEPVGGYRELIDLDASGELKRRLENQPS